MDTAQTLTTRCDRCHDTGVLIVNNPASPAAIKRPCACRTQDPETTRIITGLSAITPTTDNHIINDATTRLTTLDTNLRDLQTSIADLADRWASDPIGDDLWRSDAIDAVRALLPKVTT